MTIRKGTPADAVQIVPLLQEIVDAGGTTAFEGTVPLDFLADILDGSTSRAVVHVADVDGEVLGFQYFFPHDDDPEETATIATFAKLGGTQRGIGSALFSATRKAAKAFGYSQIDATIRADNLGGLAYYARMGFVDHHVRRAVPLKDGTPVDRVTKYLQL